MNDLKTQMQSDLNKMYDHLIKQGKKSLAESGWYGKAGKSCAYRGEVGAMCAVGCLISDEEYNPKMEGCDARQVLDNFPAAFSFITGYEGWAKQRYAVFLNRVQEHMHDLISEDANFSAQVLDGYKYVADEFGLKVERDNG